MPIAARQDDRAFVRRCRIVARGVLRLVSLAIALHAASLALRAGVEIAGYRTFGGGIRVDTLTAVSLGGGVSMAAAIWLFSGRLARMCFPEPAAGRNQCPKCKYPLEGLESDRCPECGTNIR
jgi:hypothetical protein